MKPYHTTKSEELNTQLLNHEFCFDDGFCECYNAAESVEVARKLCLLNSK